MSNVIRERRIFNSNSTGGAGGGVSSVNSGVDITVDNTDPANPIINFTGTYQDPITVVANYSALPAVGTVTGQFYWASASQGTSWLPGALGGTYYSAGLYYSNGVSWEFLSVPYNATLAEVNTGTNNDKFVTPSTLTGWNGSTNITKTGTLTQGTASTGFVIDGVTMTLGSDAIGDMYYRGATGVLTRLAAGASGTFLRFAGAGTAPTVSTNTLPNTTAANLIWYATGTNTIGTSTSFFYNGTTFKVGSTTVVKAVAQEINGQFNINNTLGGSSWSMTDSATSAYRSLVALASSTADMQFFRATGTNGSESFSETFRVTNAAGDIGIGTGATVSARLHLTKTTEQLRVGYDASNYYSTTVSSGGAVTFNAVGASSGFTFSDAVTLSDVNLILGTTTGSKIGTATTQKLGFWNATPIVQPASANQAAVAVTGATNVTPYGYTTAAQADSIVTLLNEIRLSLVNAGIIKGAA